MSDEEWAFFEPFVVEKGPRRGRRPRDHRLVLDGVFWIARTGTAWRDLHSHFGEWNSVYRQFRRWTVAGVWDVILEALNEAGAGHGSVQMIDSTIIRAHQHAAGALKMRIPRHRGHGFHGMVGTNSTRRWARIPRHRGRLSIEGMMEARPTV